MSDLIERLREGLTVLDEPHHYAAIARAMSEASDELEQANKRIAELERSLDREDYCHGITVDQRDRAEDLGTTLANMVGRYFDVDVGEHSNMNCPIEAAIDVLDHHS